MIDANDRPWLRRQIDALNATTKIATVETRMRNADGNQRWVRVKVTRFNADEGVIAAELGIGPHFVVAVSDVSEWREADEVLDRCLTAGEVGWFRRDMARGSFHASLVARRMRYLPLNDEPMTADVWFSAVLDEDRPKLLSDIADSMKRRAVNAASEYRVRDPMSGEISYHDARWNFRYGADGACDAAFGVLIDISRQRKAEQQLAFLARHDALTGLANRTLFHERIGSALARARCLDTQHFALLMIDLDRFKQVNDTLGHAAGDALLAAVGTRLIEETRSGDTVARTGGDEFAVIQVDVSSPDDAAHLARRIVARLAEPFTILGHQVLIGASVGIALAPDDGLDADQLISSADMALYRSKSGGRGRWHFFEPEMAVDLRRRRQLETDLPLAIVRNELELDFQPIVEIDSGAIVGFEALVRWNHPRLGRLRPASFVPLAEANGMIVQISEWVLNTATHIASSWPANVVLAVNISALDFDDKALETRILGALARSGLAARRLELEVTESTILHDTNANLKRMEQLRRHGIRFALDDFGTGYSALAYLERFKFDKVKLDRQFTEGLKGSPNGQVIVKAVVGLCSALGAIVTAEGVEDGMQLAALKSIGCNQAQGFWFSAPLGAEQVEGLLAQKKLPATYRNSLLPDKFGLHTI